MKRALLVLLLAGSLGACESATIPEREATRTYRFALLSPELVFHWPVGSTVRVFVASGQDATRAQALVAAADHAMNAWNDAVLFREYTMVRTQRLEDADVVLRWSDVAAPVRTPDATRCSPSIGRAVTSFCPDASGDHLLVYPFEESSGTSRVRFLVTIATSEAEPARLRTLVTHELGHTLGLWAHPPLQQFPESVMLDLPSTDRPTEVDRATIQVLYHTASTVSL